MAKLVWDKIGERFYETGVDNGVLYVTDADGKYGKGVAWNGLTAVNESPSGADVTALWADNIKYLNLVAAEEFGCTIEAYTYPDEFEVCDGSYEPAPGVYVGQQSRKTFGFTYRTKIGNDTKLDELGYKIHVVYGCLAAPSSRDYSTVNDSPEAMTLSWEVSTTPVTLSTKKEDGTALKPTATMVFDSTKLSADKMKKVEDALYGTEAEEAKLPTPDEFLAMLASE